MILCAKWDGPVKGKENLNQNKTKQNKISPKQTPTYPHLNKKPLGFEQ